MKKKQDYLHNLTDSREVVRLHAVHQLRYFGGADTVLEVAKALEDESEQVRREAIESLAWMRPANLEELVLPLLREEKKPVLMAAISVLGDWGTEKSTPALLQLLRHEDPDVALLAAQSLGSHQHPEVERKLYRLFQKEEDFRRQLIYARSLVELKCWPFMTMLLGWYFATPDPKLQSQVLELIANLCNIDPRVFDLELSQIARMYSDFAGHIEKAVASHPDTAAKEKLLKSTRRLERFFEKGKYAEFTRVLYQLFTSIITGLFLATDSGEQVDPEIRGNLTCIMAMAQQDDYFRLRPAKQVRTDMQLLAGATLRIMDRLSELSPENSPTGVDLALSQLAKAGSVKPRKLIRDIVNQGPEAEQKVISFVEAHENSLASLYGIEILGYWKSKSALPLLSRLIQVDNPLAGSYISEALGRIGEASVEPLANFIKSHGGGLWSRIYAGRALSLIRAEGVVDVLVWQLDHASTLTEQMFTIAHLKELGDPEAIAPLEKFTTQAEDRLARMASSAVASLRQGNGLD